jgi:hypothetical protein
MMVQFARSPSNPRVKLSVDRAFVLDNICVDHP